MPPTSLTAQAVADLVGGRLLGDGTVLLRGLGPLDRAGRDTLSFLVSARYLPYFRASSAGAVLVGEALAGEPEGPSTRIVVPDPQRALLVTARAFYPADTAERGIDPTARLGPGISLGADVTIGPYAVLGRRVQLGARCRIDAAAIVEDDVVVGEDSIVGPHAVCGAGSRIGRRVVLKAGAVVGGQGFGYVSGPGGHDHIPHLGGCVLEDEVEVGSCSCVDRGSLDDTIIGRGSKIDNLVHIGHNVRLGERCLVMATTGIAGSTRIGDDVIIAGGVGIADHLRIGEHARLSAKSVVVGHIPPGATVGGYPARNHRDFLRAQAALYRLPSLIDHLETIVRERSEGVQTND